MPESTHTSNTIPNITQPAVPALPQLAVGSDFTALRAQGALLINKMPTLPQLDGFGFIFMSRPPGMGKSMLASTVRALYSQGYAPYEDLLEPQQRRRSYLPVTVIALSLKGLNRPETLVEDIYQRLRAAFIAAGFSWAQEDQFARCSGLFGIWLLSYLRSEHVALIVDDWDYPLTSLWHDPSTFAANAKAMHHFFAWIYRFIHRNSALTLCLGTGSYWSLLDRLGELLFEWNWGYCGATMMGYTPEELDTYFGPYLSLAAARMGRSEDELKAELKRHYGGYCFAQYESCLYQPRAVNAFFAQLNDPQVKTPRLLDFEACNPELASILRWGMTHCPDQLEFLEDLAQQDLSLTRYTFYNTFDSEGQLNWPTLLINFGLLSAQPHPDSSPYDWLYFNFTNEAAAQFYQKLRLQCRA